MPDGLVLSIDQGTTGTTALVFDLRGGVRGRGYSELTQHYPRPGWVEHDAEEIWQSVRAVVPEALAGAGVGARDLAALGVTNQRETVVLWERGTGKPLARAVVWQDRRTADFCRARQGVPAGRAAQPGGGGRPAVGAVRPVRLRAWRGQVYLRYGGLLPGAPGLPADPVAAPATHLAGGRRGGGAGVRPGGERVRGG